jgi:hypothetical protein
MPGSKAFVDSNVLFNIYDAMIVSAALLAGCSLLYSEDMQHDLVVNNTLQNDLLSIWKNQLST